jgi:hypothetical protein
MRRITLYIVCTFFCLLLAGILPAQGRRSHAGKKDAATAPSPVVIKITVDKQKILIGQPIQLMLEATVPVAALPPGGAGTAKPGATSTSTGSPGVSPSAPALIWPNLDTLPHFEWMEKGKVDSVIRSDSRYYRQYTTITSFDSGAWYIPRLSFIAGNKKYFSDSVRIEVDYTKIDPSKDYHDIKDIIDIPNPFAKWIPWIVAGVTLAALALIVWLVRKKKKLKLVTAAAPVIRLSPYWEAIRQLEELEQQHLPENGSMKIYYTRLSDIFRLYLFRRLGISSLAETSEELMSQLRRLPVAAENFPETAETLRMSDFVKFAKYQPGIADSDHHFRVVRSFIEAMEKAAKEREIAAEEENEKNK